jgi:DNA-binding IclR family transcriptional regulator
MVRAGYDCVCADRLEGSYPVKTLVVEVGSRRPLGIGAGSLAILSALPPNEAENVILHNAHRIAAFSGMSVERLRRLAGRARAEKSASLEVTGVPGVHALAIALHPPSGDPVAALSVCAIKSRMTNRRRMLIISILRRECNLLAASFVKQ